MNLTAPVNSLDLCIKEVIMSHWAKNFPIIILISLILTGCSGEKDNPVSPETVRPGTEIQAAGNPGNFLLGYYDIYFDPSSCTFDVAGNRTVDFTINIVPFLNQKTYPMYGISLEDIVLHDDIPGVLGVDVDFQIHHPYPTLDLTRVYDVMGVVIGDGSLFLDYENLRAAGRFTDLWMKNPDGYTRWFNPSEFWQEGVFGYMPGGFQNYAGNAQVNPYKYYAEGLEPDADEWDLLTGENTYESRFHSDSGRLMELEFVVPPDGIGIRFGYAVVACWEDQGDGPYTPYHRKEAIAASVSVTEDIWFDGVKSGGDLILDFDLYAWEQQPDIVKIESTVLDGIAEFDASEIGEVVNENVSSYHLQVPSGEINTLEGHEFWIIAESLSYDYSNDLGGFPYPAGPLASFYRFPLSISTGPINQPPVITEIYDDIMGQGSGYQTHIPDETFMPVTYTVDFYDLDMDLCSVKWYCTVIDVAINEIEDEVGDSEHCPIDWITPDFGHGEWDLYARVDDGYDHVQSKIMVTVNNPPNVDGVFGESEIPTVFTGAYSVVATDLDTTDTLEFDWTVMLVGGDEITDGVTIIDDGEIEVDWAVVGASDLDEYSIDCDIYDGYEMVSAETLIVTTTDYVPLFNIPLREGFNACDLAVDHSNGDLLILYAEDGAVYKYTEDGYYQDGYEFVLTFEPGMDFIDIAPNGCFIVGGEFESGSDKAKFYNSDGTLIGVSGSEMYESHGNDVIAFTGHTYTNMLGNSSFTPQSTYMRWRFYEPPNYTIYNYGNLYRGCSPNTFVYAHVRGAECGNISMNWVYYIEGGGYYWDLEPQPHQWVLCDEFRVQRVWRESEGVLVNDPDVSWGGIQSDGMDGFNDPKDITRDSDNDFYILDILSTGEPLIKKYTELGVEIGAFGDSTAIAGTPLRIEGSDYEGTHGNLMFVLHGSEPADLLSVFYPMDIPD